MAAKEFKKQFRAYPNIMLANSRTYEKIDLTAEHFNKVACKRVSGLPKAGEHVCLASFNATKYSLEMCIDEKIMDNRFVLTYDTDDLEEVDEGIVKKDKNIAAPARDTWAL